MARRIQDLEGEERSVAKSKSTETNLSSHVPTSSSSAKSPIASESLWILEVQEKPGSRMKENQKSSQARQQDAYLGWLMDTATEKFVATKEESGDVDPSESETGSEEDVTGKTVARETATEKHYASSKSDCEGGPEAEKVQWSHNIHVSPATIHHTEAVSSIVRGVFGREHDDLVKDLNVNMNATPQAAVHIGQDSEVNLRYVGNNLRNRVEVLFNESEKLINERFSVNLSTSKTGSSSCKCLPILYGMQKGNEEHCNYNSQAVAKYASKSFAVIGLSRGLGTELTLTNPMVHGIEW